MSLCDIITQFIMDQLTGNGVCEIGRNELANKFNCAPSQINYVITTRFGPNQGYIVQSRRGGGGYVRITRPYFDKRSKIMHIINAIGGEIDANTANIFIKNMADNDFMSKKEADMIDAAISERSLKIIPNELKNQVRAVMFKNMLVSLL